MELSIKDRGQRRYLESDESDMLDMMVKDLWESSNRYSYNVASSIDGKDYYRLYYDNLHKVKQDVSDTFSRSGFAWFRDEVWFFTGKIYERVANDAIFRRAIRLFLDQVHVPTYFIEKSMRTIVMEVLDTLKIHRLLKPRFNVMAFKNGVVDMKKGELMPFSRDHHVMYLHDYEFDPNAKCPMWREFLMGKLQKGGRREGGVLPNKDDRAILQMFLGLGLYDRGTMNQKVENSLVLFGTGSNGKSVIMETVMGVFGNQNVSNLSMEALLRGGDEKQRNMSQIDGKIFNWSGEMEARSFSGREDAAKSLISGEPQLARRIGSNAFTVTNVPYFIFNANHFPTGSDSSYGFFRRFIFIVFDKVVDERKQNLQLAKDLVSEYPGILNWIRKGAVLLRKNKFKFPESEGGIRKKVTEMGLSALGKSWAFARGFYAYPRKGVVGDRHNEVDFADIYKDIVNYAEENGFPVVSKQTIASHFKDLGFGKDHKRKTGGTVIYKCFGLHTDDLRKPVPIVVDMDVDIDNEEFVYDEEEAYY